MIMEHKPSGAGKSWTEPARSLRAPKKEDNQFSEKLIKPMKLQSRGKYGLTGSFILGFTCHA